MLACLRRKARSSCRLLIRTSQTTLVDRQIVTVWMPVHLATEIPDYHALDHIQLWNLQMLLWRRPITTNGSILPRQVCR